MKITCCMRLAMVTQLSARLHHVLLMLGVGLGAPVLAAQSVPHLNPVGQQDFQTYLASPAPKAFAIAPGGAWGWVSDRDSSAQAQSQALAACQANTRQKCVLYARDAQVVLDAQAWPRLWGPYLSAAQTKKAPLGRELGQRFHDLVFTDASGKRTSVQAFQGQVLVLHFWGSWCGPCRREMPELQRLYSGLKADKSIAMVLLQVRESFATSQKWARAQGLQLPWFDSGAQGLAQPSLSDRNGQRLHDREIASVFPSTYVLDKRGVVLLAHFGPVEDWSEYAAFLQDAARRSGQ